MKKVALISFLLVFGLLNISATKEDKLQGKWVAYKMIHEGQTRDLSESKRIPWINFAADNVLWSGEGKKEKRRGEWWLDKDNKTIHLIFRNKDRKMSIKHLSKNKLVLLFADGRSSTKSFWNKAS